VTLWPTTVAPNTVRSFLSYLKKGAEVGLRWQITLSGLALVFINFLTMLYYDPSYLNDKGEGVPRWVYFS